MRRLCVWALAWCGLAAVASGQPGDDRRYEKELLDDAARRTSLLSSGRAGHDGGFFIESADGKRRLNVGGYAQFRYMATYDDDDASGDETRNGFETARARLIFGGKLDDDLAFLLLPGAGPAGSFVLFDMWVEKSFENGVKLKLGQFKLPGMREWLVSERYNSAVERSTLSQVYASIYSQGVLVSRTGDNWRWSASYNDGFRSFNSAFTSGAKAEWGLSGRAERRFGEASWGDFKDLTALGTEEPGWLLGAAIHGQGETNAFRGVALSNLVQATADVSYEGVGWSAFGTVVGRYIDGGGAIPDESTVGLIGQGAWFATEKLELVGRYGLILPDSDSGGSHAFHEITAGVNYYVRGHRLKLSGDVMIAPTPTPDVAVIGLATNALTGLIVTPNQGQAALRLQVQYLF